jgi:phage shock protein A
MTRTEIKEAIEWNATDIDDAKEAVKEARKDLADARARKAELKAKLSELRTQAELHAKVETILLRGIA